MVTNVSCGSFEVRLEGSSHGFLFVSKGLIGLVDKSFDTMPSFNEFTK